MAEGFLRRQLADRGIEGIRVESAGVAGLEGSPAAPESVEALAENDIDISEHLARRMTFRQIGSADLVLAMSSEHRAAVPRISPSAAARTFTLKELVNLLDQQRLPAPGGDPDERLRTVVELAGALRDAGRGEDLLDEDIADPLGLSLHAFRAAAWEIGELTTRLVDKLYGPVRSVRPDGDGAGAGRVGMEAEGRDVEPTERRTEPDGDADAGVLWSGGGWP